MGRCLSHTFSSLKKRREKKRKGTLSSRSSFAFSFFFISLPIALYLSVFDDFCLVCLHRSNGPESPLQTIQATDATDYQEV